MKSVVSFLIFYLITPAFGYSQITGTVNSPFNSIRQNSVSSMAAFGDTLWVSPKLNRLIDGETNWYSPENADSVINGKGRAFSMALKRDTIVAGLGFTAENEISGPVSTGYGFYFSTDGGTSWRFSDFPLDSKPPDRCISSSEEYEQPMGVEDYDPDCDIIFQYGGNMYTRTRITVPQQSVPFSTDIHGNTVFSAVWATGLLRSTDLGNSWERVILPPSYASTLHPEGSYFWSSRFTFFNEDIQDTDTATINRYDPLGDFNLLGFSVLIDSQDRLWYGSAAGINISENALTAPIDSISWRHISYDNSSDGLLSNWIIEIDEDPQTGTIWMTNWIAEGNNASGFGVVSTNDGGQSFEHHLIGERINDIDFKGDYIFAAGDNGLFISPDRGKSWIKQSRIKSPNTFIRSSARHFSLAVTTNKVWVGTSDGIASTSDLGNSWDIIRTNFPLSGGNAYDQEAPDVESYAYPNPFSPSTHEVVRLKFEVPKSGNVKIGIYDFGMNLVREIENNSFSPGTYEAVWDGYDSKGSKVNNAPYIYIIEVPGKQINGKILVVD
ncbi:MAG: hypothetical protein FH748_08600 [Balneolaceae bacterium]|nr:hypothetical protein [Balneolaceae bacterium]